jgi:hypothetical protein
MNNNLHIIFSKSDCPSHEQLMAYFKGSMTEEEKHVMERHLTDCEMCSDELEGISVMKDPGRLPEIVAEMGKRMTSGKGLTRKMNYRILLSAAAVLVIIITGSVFLFRNNPVKEPASFQAMEKALSPELSAPESPPVSGSPGKEQLAVITQKEKVHEQSPAKERAVVDEKKDAVVADQEMVREEPTSKGESAAVPAEPSQKPAAGQEIVAGVVSPVNADADKGVTLMAKKQAPKDEQMKIVRASSRARPAASPGDSAMVYYNNREYAQAARLFESVLVTQPGNSGTAYYLAVCYYELNNFSKSRESLVKILADPQNAYYRKGKGLLRKLESKSDTLR